MAGNVENIVGDIENAYDGNKPQPVFTPKQVPNILFISIFIFYGFVAVK